MAGLVRAAPRSTVLVWITLVSVLCVRLASASDYLKTYSVTQCDSVEDTTLHATSAWMEYNRTTRTLQYHVEGSSTEERSILVDLAVDAYGKQVFSQSLDPCASSSHVADLCPVQVESLDVTGSYQFTREEASVLPDVAFSIPNLDCSARLRLLDASSEEALLCVTMQITNGVSVRSRGVTYATVGVAAGSFLLSAVSASLGHAGSSVGVMDMVGWFQAVAWSSSLSVDYPQIYREFCNNFQWSSLLIGWKPLQDSIDSMRSHTGANITDSSFGSLANTQVEYTSNSSLAGNSSLSLAAHRLSKRETATTFVEKTRSGITAFVESVRVPSQNTFMTAFLIYLIVVGAIMTACMLGKLSLEGWASWARGKRMPKLLQRFRANYHKIMWGMLVRTVIIMFCVWTVICLYQFKSGDSWLATLLAALTFSAFVLLLASYSARILVYYMREERQKSMSPTRALYSDEKFRQRYGVLYDSYRLQSWWFFLPIIIYAFVKGCIIALGDGHGRVQVGGHIGLECLMLFLFVFFRPFNVRSANIVNILICVVRLVIAVCTLVFVEELGVSATTKSVLGIVLIAVQAVLTVALVILMVVGLIIQLASGSKNKPSEEDFKYGSDDGTRKADYYLESVQSSKKTVASDYGSAFSKRSEGDVFIRTDAASTPSLYPDTPSTVTSNVFETAFDDEHRIRNRSSIFIEDLEAPQSPRKQHHSIHVPSPLGRNEDAADEGFQAPSRPVRKFHLPRSLAASESRESLIKH